MKTLLDYLREDGHEPRKEGSRWVVLCPFHKEKTPSFSIEPEKGDGGLYKCFGCGAGGDCVTYLEKARKLSKKAALRLHKGPPSGERTSARGANVRSEEHKADAPPKQPPFVADLPGNRIGEWEHKDAKGKLKFKVIKLPPGPDGKKKIRPYTRGKKGSKRGWIIKNFMERDRPLYRLPELLKAPEGKQVIVVEGEKCVDATFGAFKKAVVTTWSHGTDSWRRTDFSPLFGREVLLVADADDSGRKAMLAIADHLAPHGGKIGLVLPEGDTGDDIADEIEKGGAKGGAKWLQGLAKAYEPPKPEEPPPADGPVPPGAGGTTDASDENRAPYASDAPDTAESTGTPNSGETKRKPAVSEPTDTQGGSKASGTADATFDGSWIEQLLARAKTDPGAPFEPETVEKIKELRRTKKAAWIRLRAKLKKTPGIMIGMLDQATKRSREDASVVRLQGQPLEWKDDEPWPDKVDTGTLLDEIKEIILRYISMSEVQADTIAPFMLYFRLHDEWSISTFLSITSATRRCGKTTLLSVLKALSYRPLSLSTHPTSPVLFRTIEKYGPTLTLDETDTYIHQDPDLRGLINGSQEKDSAYALRMVKANDDFEPGSFRTWCPKILATIGNLPSTIRDRSIVIRLERRAKGDGELQFWGDRDEEEIEDVRRKLARWTMDNSGSVRRKRSTLCFPPQPSLILPHRIGPPLGYGKRRTDDGKEAVQA